jgi:hypothetical protein
MKTSVKQYIPALEKYLFQGQTLHQIDGCLYQCNNLMVEIHASKPDSEAYFFPVKMPKYVDMCLFVCGKELVVFCLAPDFLRSLPLSKERNDNYRVFNLVAEHSLNGEALLICRKDEKEKYPINITQWGVPLYEPIIA